MIPYARQSINEDDIEAVADTLRSVFLTQGPKVKEFEDRLAEFVGARFTVVVSSGTAALHAAYFAAGVGPGRVVLVPPVTFVATVNAARYLGAEVTLADVDPDAALLDPRILETSRSRADVIAPVHLGGHVTPMVDVAAVARRLGAIVIEDAAHALGASYTSADGTEFRVGSCAHSAMCCFSFHPVKHITTGEGGAVSTNDEELYQRLLMFRSHGITRNRGVMTRDDGPWYYEQHHLGYNYRLTDFQCSLGISQLNRLPEFLQQRRKLAARYDSAFADCTDVRPIKAPSWSHSAYHLYVIRVDPRRRREIYDALRNDGVEVNVHYIPLYRHPYYAEILPPAARFPNAEAYYQSAISIPMFAGMSDADADYVISRVRRAVE